MNLVSSIKPVLLTLGLGVAVAACDNTEPTPTPTTYTWTKVSADIKANCATSTGCHMKGTAQTFSYDTTLTPGSDMANYTLLTADATYINKTTPASSELITVGSGGKTADGVPHSAILTSSLSANWILWITAGATYP